MNETPTMPAVVEDEQLTFWDRHRLSLLLLLTVVVALVLTVVSVIVYTVSGAAQLDLSRPGYKEVSDQVDRSTRIDQFSASGSIDSDIIREYLDLYDEQAKKAKAVDAFNGDPLNPELLQLASPNGQ